MKKITKRLFMLGVIILFFGLIAQPVIAADTYDYVYSVSYNEIPYGNGQDDDGDGVIDNIEEEDVDYGDFDINETNPLIDDWNTSFNNEYYDELDLREEGIAICPYYEQVWEIESSNNASVNHQNNICYYYQFDMRNTIQNDSFKLCEGAYIPAVRYYVNFSAEDVMNGAQEIWYRSPLVYDQDTMDGHILNIYRADDNQLVWSNINNSNTNYDNNDGPLFKKDNSTIDAMADYYRVYYRLNFPLRSGERYRIEEYISFDGDDPQNTIKLYMAPFQDLADDQEQATYIFFGTSNARKIPRECSWSMLFKFGIGPVGTEIPIKPSKGDADPILNSQILQGSMNDVSAVTVLVPMRMTKEAGEIELELTTMSGGSVQTDSISVDPTGGSMICSFNISDPDAGEPNYYELKIKFHDWNRANGKLRGDVLTLCMYPSDNDCIVVDENGNNTDLQHYFFGLHWELSEHSDPINEAYEETTDEVNWLALGVILLGIGLIIIAPAIGFTIMHSGIVSAMTIGTAAMIGTASVGAYTTIKGFEFLTGEEYINNFLEWSAQGIARVYTGISEGINVLVGGIVKTVVQTIQAIVHFGELILYYGTNIVEAIIDIIYLITFFIVIWITQKFLLILTAIAENRPQDAFKQFVKIEGGTRQITSRTRKTYNIGKKTAKTIKRRKRSD